MCTVQTQQCTNSWEATTDWLWTPTLTPSLSVVGLVLTTVSLSVSLPPAGPWNASLFSSLLFPVIDTLDFSAPLIPCSSQIKRNNSLWWEQTKSCLRTSPTKSTRSNHLFKSINKRAYGQEVDLVYFCQYWEKKATGQRDHAYLLDHTAFGLNSDAVLGGHCQLICRDGINISH